MSEVHPRVALLARAGEACDRLGDALREAGAEVVLVADPVIAAPSTVRDARPQVVVVALEPATEDALDAFGELLADPSHLVIFEEAELAAQRSGWDAARWRRHLSAKLHRHADVLPPGGEDEMGWEVSPGPLPSRPQLVDAERRMAEVADEARQLAGDVPVDSGLLELVRDDALPTSSEAAAEEMSVFDPVAFEMSDMATATFEATFVSPQLSLEGDAAEAVMPSQATEVTLTFGDVPAGFDAIAFDAAPPAESAPPVQEARVFDIGGLSLVEDDAQIEHARPAMQPQATQALDELESRISGLSLLDMDTYGHGTEHGAVLIDGGLGGPDAVRQVLAALPEGFPRPILVRLQLDGGRYDRLVRQMERATAMPVLLATANAEATAGSIHFLPPELGLRRDKARLVFDEGASVGQLLPDALPPGDSAVLLLSGASRRVADALAAPAWSAALVAGQSPAGSYDPDAALALGERGGVLAPPNELVDLLVKRWPPAGGAATEADLEESEI